MHLFGREAEREAVAEALEGHRALVLTGIPGIGKSALAASFCVDIPALWIDARTSLEGDVLRLASTGRRDQAQIAVVDDVPPGEPPERIQALIEELGIPVILTSRRPLELPFPHIQPKRLSPTEGVALIRSALASPARAATLDAEGLRGLSQALGGVPDALRRAALRLDLESLEQLLEDVRGTSVAAAKPQGPVQQWVLNVLVRLPGPISPRLLQDLLKCDVRGALAELTDQGFIERFPSGRTWVRLRPMGPTPSDGGPSATVQVHKALAELLPHWEALAEQVEHGWRGPTAKLREDLPALEWLSAGKDPDTALRAAYLAALVYRRLGPEARVRELGDRLPQGGSPALRQRWQTQLARSLLYIGEGRLGLSALAQGPATPGSLLAIEQTSLRGRLLDITDQREEGARLQSLAMHQARGTPLQAQVCYRDAIRRYWSGDFDGALDSVSQSLERSDPEVHGVRVVRATLLKSLIRRELGADSAELLVELSPIDDLWRRVECESGATVLVVMAALLVDLGRWAQADARLSEAIQIQLRRGRRGHAINQILQRSSFVYLSGRVPDLRLAPALGVPSEQAAAQLLSPLAAAELQAWKAVRAAAMGQSAAAATLAEPALRELAELGRPLRAAEFCAYLAGALLGSGCPTGDYLERVHGSPLMARLSATLRAALDQGPPPSLSPARMEVNVLQALIQRRDGVRVDQDGARFSLPGQAPVSMARKVVLRRILAGLAEHAEGLDIQALIACGWPDETLVGDSGRRRAEVAIYNLRRLGLRDAIRVDRDAAGTRWRLQAVILPVDQLA